MDNHILLLNLNKSNNNKNGLIQQVITYVRDGKVITRKQWVRSEFADHAKKNEEQKKKAILNQAKKEQKKHERDIEESNLKHALKDMADRRKLEASKRKLEEPKTEEEKEQYAKRKDLLSRTRKEEIERQEEDIRRKNKNAKEKTKNAKENRTSYGQEEQTRADSKREIDNIVRLHRDNATLSGK